MIKEFCKVYETTDYSLFKKLEGNRTVTEQRAQKIEKNILENGYILNPIVVNEKYEIIDGQGRCIALSKLRMPIHFVIAQGSGVKECAALNSATTPWKITDYVNSYSELGNENYIRLKELFEQNNNLPINSRCSVITGLYGRSAQDAIKSGKIVITQEMANHAKSDFEMIQGFVEDLYRVKGSFENYVYVIAFANKCGLDMRRLKKVMSANTLPPAPTRRTALDNISDLYNKKLPIERRVYLYQMYEESLVSKYGWYGSRLTQNGGKGWHLSKTSNADSQ